MYLLAMVVQKSASPEGFPTELVDENEDQTVEEGAE